MHSGGGGENKMGSGNLSGRRGFICGFRVLLLDEGDFARPWLFNNSPVGRGRYLFIMSVVTVIVAKVGGMNVGDWPAAPVHGTGPGRIQADI